MRYFFQTENGEVLPDEDGTELADLSQACIEASRVLGDFLRDEPRALWANDTLSLRVTDDKGLVLFTLRLSVTLSAALGGRRPTV